MTTDLLTHNAWVTRRPLTVAEYHQMGEAGILTEDDRVELIEGQLVAMSPIGSDHYGTVNGLNRLLVMSVGNRGVVSVQNPVRLNDLTEPQPDFTVLKPRDDDYRRAIIRPEHVLLLVEIANCSLRYDRNIKIPLYAQHGIAEVWIVDLVAHHVEVYRKPSGDAYAEISRVKPPDILRPTLLPDCAISAASILG